MAKITDIKENARLTARPQWKVEQNHIAAAPTPEGCFLISQPSHQVLLTREQAAFVLPHLQRWLEEK